MNDFKVRFAEYNASTGEYAFSNVRNGLIVGLVGDLSTSWILDPQHVTNCKDANAIFFFYSSLSEL